MQSGQENILIVDSSFRSNKNTTTPTKFECHYQGAVHFHEAEHVRVKSISVPNMFNNVYGYSSEFYYTHNGTPKSTKVAGRFNIDQLILYLNSTASGSDIIFSKILDASGRTYVGMRTKTIGNTVFLPTSDEINAIRNGVKPGAPSLLDVLGFHPSPNVVALSHDFDTYGLYPVNLIGPKTVYVKSEKLALGHSIVPSGNIDSVFTFIHLDMPFGCVCHRTIHERYSDSLFFPSEVDCNTIDIKLVDEYDMQLELPSNFDIQLQLIIGNSSAD